jgi:beta-glucosidase
MCAQPPPHTIRPAPTFPATRLAAMGNDHGMQELLTAGIDMWHLAPLEGRFRSMKVSDGPAGARGERWFGTSSACVPCGTALGATWSPEVAAEVAGLLARETRRKGADVLLAPTVNLHRHPLAGRNFECMSEDPELTARLAVAWIRELQAGGVGACVKHFAANDQETDRHSISAVVGEAELRELYLRPFEAAVREAGTWTIMSAYNRLGGTYCSQHHWLLSEVLRDEWGFDGAVLSDWWGTHDTSALDAGLDVEMPGPPRHLGPAVASGIADGTVQAESLERAVSALELLAERVGALSGHSQAIAAERSVDDPADRALMRRAAVQSMVLLRNDRSVLPIGRGSSIAVCGPNAANTAIMGGGSAWFVPHRRTDVLGALHSRLDGVTHHRGVPAPSALPALRSPDGFTVEHFAAPEPNGQPVLVERSLTSRLFWMGAPAPGLAESGTSVRLTADLVAESAGSHEFGLVTGATGWLALNGTLLLDNRRTREPGRAFFGLGSAEQRVRVELAAGEEFRIEAVTTPLEGLPVGGLAIGHAEPEEQDPVASAVAAATDADVAVVVVGGNDEWETEGHDRAGFELPGGQPELVRAVCASNRNTVVVVNCGSPVDLSCARDAAAVLLCWYPGQEGGDAVADVLLGDADPAGRLPSTWGRRQSDWPSDPFFPGDGEEVDYGEGFDLGYRGFDRLGVEPAFCFGHGLGFADFDWTDARTDRQRIDTGELLAGGFLEASVTLTNTSNRTGSEVVQCYLSPTGGCAVREDRPPQHLAGFQKVELAPGETTRVSIPLDMVAFRRWESGWVLPSGDWTVRLSASSRDHRFELPLRTI